MTSILGSPYTAPIQNHQKPAIKPQMPQNQQPPITFGRLYQVRHIPGDTKKYTCSSEFLRDEAFMKALPNLFNQIFQNCPDPIPIKYFGACNGAQYYALGMLLLANEESARKFELSGSDVVPSIINIAKKGILPMTQEEVSRYQTLAGVITNSLYLKQCSPLNAWLASRLYKYKDNYNVFPIPDSKNPNQTYYQIKGKLKTQLAASLSVENLQAAIEEIQTTDNTPEIWFTRNIWNHFDTQTKQLLVSKLANSLPSNSLIILGLEDIKKLPVDKLFIDTRLFHNIPVDSSDSRQSRLILQKNQTRGTANI